MRTPLRSALLAVVVLATAAVGPPAARAQAPAAAPSPLRWGADAEGGAPYIFLDPADPDRVIGFEVDLAAALGRELGRPVVHEQYNYDGLISGLNRGDFDLAMNGLEVTPDRQEHVRFSRPYYVYTLQLVARADETRFRSIEDVVAQQLVVATLAETAASRYLERNGLEPASYDSQAEPYQDLALGRVDAVLMDLPIAAAYAKPNPKLKYVGEPFERGTYAIALRKDDAALADDINAALGRLLESGELQRIYEQWDIWNDDQALLKDPQASRDLISETAAGLTIWGVLIKLLLAAKVTIVISVASMALAMVLGLIVAVGRLYGPRPVQWLAVIWVEFFRGIPVLLLLYVLYFGLPTFLEHLNLGFIPTPSRIAVAILAFGLNYSAYEAEIYRGGISAIPQGQWEAAASLGMSPRLTFRRVILPQALRTILPPVTNDFVALFKDTSVASAIAVVELTKQYQIFVKSSQRYLEVGLATALLYLLMSAPLGYVARRLEQRLGKAP